MGHGAGDAVLDPVRATTRSLQFRLGIEFRFPDRPPAPPESLLPARYLQIQVASPPPDRIDGSPWYSGLRVYDNDGGDREFIPEDATWKQTGVFPREGISPFGQPQPETLVYDRWVRIAAVPPVAALTTAFALTDPDQPDPDSNHFLSIPYPRPTIGGTELTVAGVNYYTEGTLDFTKNADKWIAVSFDRFWPPERASADYVVEVKALAKQQQRLVAAGGGDAVPLAPYPIDRAW
jgi:hypothetical protein